MSAQALHLRELLARPGPIVAPGVYDALTARLVERAGFEVALASGAAISASVLGLPDLGLMTMTESLAQTRNICGACSIAIVADCDTGYGNPLNVRRTVQEFERAGVAGLFIEDQVSPKRCGHFENKEIVSTQDMVSKIRAACDARTAAALVIVARTDAIALEGVDGALARATVYTEAGADVVFVEAPTSIEELRRVGSWSRAPLMINLVEGGKTPLLSVAELSMLGFKLITMSGLLQKAAMKTMNDVLRHVAVTGRPSDLFPTDVMSLAERSEILGLAEFNRLSDVYGRNKR